MMFRRRVGARVGGAAFAGWLMAAVLSGALALMVRHVRRFPGTDVMVFADAGASFRAARPLYEHGFRYQPGIAALFVPLSWMPPAVMKVAWAGVSACLLSACAALLMWRLPRARRWVAPVAVLALFHPVARELQLGQVDVLVLVSALVAFELEDRGRHLTAGIVLALPIAMKVAPVLLLVAAVLQRRWRVMVGTAAGFAVLLATVAWRYGPAGALREHASWVTSQLALTIVHLRNPCNQSLPGILHLAGAGPTLASAAALSIAGIALSVRDVDARRALLLAALPLVTANGWIESFVLALPLVTLLAAGGGLAGWAALGLALATGLLGFDVLGARGEAWALAHGLLGVNLLALFALGYLRLRWMKRPELGPAQAGA
jgi:hypothetical protein